MKTSKTKGFLLESILWSASSATLIVLSVALVYLLAIVLTWGVPTMVFAMMAASLLTMTWGSWAALIWTENRALRLAMESVTIVPGVLILALGVLGLYVGWGTWYLWAGVLFPSGGTIAAALLLARRLGLPRALANSSWPRILGWTLFPVATILASGVIAFLWLEFITRPTNTDWRSLFNLASFMATILAVSLTTTVIPAAVSRACRQLAFHLEARR